MTGQFNSGLSAPDGVGLADYDAIIDTVLAGRPARVLCLYDRHRFPDGAIERMRAQHRIEIEAPALYDDGLLRVTRLGPFRMRLAGEVDHSNRPVVARMIAATLDEALRSDDPPAALELDLSSLRFLDVAGAVGLVHAAEGFPEAHRLALSRVRPGVLRALDRCGAPFAAQLDVTAHPGVSPGLPLPGRGRRPRCPAPPHARGHGCGEGRDHPHRRCRAAAPRGAGSPASAADVVALAAPSVAAARGRDEPVALAVRPATARALAAVPPAAGLPAAPTGATVSATVAARRSPGPDHSGQTLAARWARELRTLTRGRGGVTVIVEHDPDLDGLDGGFWTELDAALNVALADIPATLLCLYPQLPLHLEVADGARHNHPLVLVDGALRHNAEHRGAREVLTDRGGVPAPVLLGPPGPGHGLRHLAARRGARHRRPGGAGGRLRPPTGWRTWCWRSTRSPRTPSSTAAATRTSRCGPGTRELLCEVHDGGRLVDPLPGLRAPHPSDPRGRGLWIARQLCDLLHVWGDDAGTHVRIRALR